MHAPKPLHDVWDGGEPRQSSLWLTSCSYIWLQAAHLPHGSLERLLKVTAFIVSIYSCVYRPFVPFRSPAGETSEALALDRGIRAIAEKVSGSR